MALIVLRKNSIRTGKMMEMLRLTSLVSSRRDCPNPGASCDRITIFFSQIAFLPTRNCAILNHVSFRPLGIALARFFRSFRW